MSDSMQESDPEGDESEDHDEDEDGSHMQVDTRKQSQEQRVTKDSASNELPQFIVENPSLVKSNDNLSKKNTTTIHSINSLRHQTTIKIEKFDELEGLQ